MKTPNIEFATTAERAEKDLQDANFKLALFKLDYEIFMRNWIQKIFIDAKQPEDTK